MIYKIVRRFIPLAIIVTALCGLVYLTAQQGLRQNANDPQIQMAEGAVAQIEDGTPSQIAATTETTAGTVIDIRSSLAPYLVVYDQDGNPIVGTGFLDGELAALPPGVFGYATANGEQHFTWQPRPDVRQAVVLIPLSNGKGFVMAGRSLREVEFRELQAEYRAAAVWLITIGTLLPLEIFFALIEKWCFKRERRS